MNRRIILAILCLLTQFKVIEAQTTSEANSYRRGDKVKRQQVTYMPLEENGQHAVWDLSGMEVMNNTIMRFLGEEADCSQQVVCIVQSRRMPYTLCGDSLLIDGYEDYTTRMNYDLKEAWLQFPMYYGQSLSGFLSGRGFYCDKVFVRELGSYTTKADATGMFILPDGDTLRHVLRLTTERIVSTVMQPLDSVRSNHGDSIIIDSPDSIAARLICDGQRLLYVIRRWYAAGYRYPILEDVSVCRAEDRAKVPLQAMAYYYPPEAQEQLPTDDVNIRIREAIARGEYNSENEGANRGAGNGFDSNDDKKNPFSHYQIQQNEENKTITVSYGLTGTHTVSFMISNTSGIVYRSMSQTNNAGNGYTATLSYSGVSRGQYVLSIGVDGNTTSSANVKFVIK